jgi:CubicO group peptidase (beta-lactamase class C family)
MIAAILTLLALGSPEERIERLVSRLEQRRQDLHIPGLSLALVRPGEAPFTRAFGLRNVEQGLPVTGETLFAIGSTTKAFTTMLIAMLQDEGVMHWDDLVRDHIPFFQLADAEVNRSITLRDLLCHRSGHCRQSILWYGRTVDRADVLRQAGEAQALRPFRSTFQYSNVMYLAAGYAAAQAAEVVDWDTLLRQRILDPLGMTRSTSLAAPFLAREDRSLGYSAHDGELQTALPLRDLTAIGPAGSIFSCAVDLVPWLQLLLQQRDGADEPLVSADRLQEMWTPQEYTSMGPSYALGWFVRDLGKDVVIEHGGNIDGFSAQIGLFPDRGIGFALLTNVGATSLQQESLRMVWECLTQELDDDPDSSQVVLGRPGPALGEALLEAYVGSFEFPGGDEQAQLSIEDRRLTLHLPEQPSLPLRWPDREGRWALDAPVEAYLEFDRTDTGFVTQATLFQGPVILPLRRIEQEEPLPLTIDELLEQVAEGYGTAVADELGPIYLEGTLRHVHQGLTGAVKAWFDGIDRFRLEVDYGAFGESRYYLNGSQSHRASLIERPEDTDDPFFAILLANPAAQFGDWFDVFDDLEVVRAEVSHARRLYVVKGVREGEIPVTRYIDAKSGRIVREQGARFGIDMPSDLIWYEDFRDLGNGVWIPFRQTVEVPDHGESVLQFQRVELGHEFPLLDS